MKSHCTAQPHRGSELRSAAALAFLLLGIGSSLAQKDNRPYLRLDAGLNLLPSTELSLLNAPNPSWADTEFAPGYRLDLAAGMLLRNGGLFIYKSDVVDFDVVAELNLGVTHNAGTKVENVDLDALGGKLDLYQFPFMANVLFRGTLLHERLHLSVGGGVGAVLSLLDVNSRTDSGSESDFVFGYQAIARLDYDLNERLSAGLSYRFMGTAEAKYEGDLQLGNDGTFNHGVLLSLNWVF